MFMRDTFSNPLQSRVEFVAVMKIAPPVIREIEFQLGLPAQPV
jgi:hypothetical protein